jgi:hypothetical protein
MDGLFVGVIFRRWAGRFRYGATRPRRIAVCSSVAQSARGAVRRSTAMALAVITISSSLLWCTEGHAAPLSVGFAHSDITPELHPEQPVWLAGYFPGRRATGVHDPLYARCVVLASGQTKLAFVSVDLIGLQYPVVRRIRGRLQDFDYVLVSSTHNHEGPDVIGCWGRTFLHRGVDDRYVELVVARVVAAVRAAERSLEQANAAYGSARDDSLIHDTRLPIVKDGVLRLLRFTGTGDGAVKGLVVQWNCHPEALGPNNTLLTADFPAATIAALARQHNCPVVYFTGTIGGLMAPPPNRIRDDAGNWLQEGDFEYARRYGEAVAQLAEQANADAEPIRMTPFHVSVAATGIPVTNELYRWARLLGVIRRDAYAWDPQRQTLGEQLTDAKGAGPAAIKTEVGYLRLGELDIAAIPGEIYPELVYGRIEDPPQPGVDYPDAPLEPSVVEILPGDKWMLFGMANDEIGYLIPRRQWDREPPYAYGRSAPQYGEINSCGPDAAASVMHALRARVAEVHATAGGN